jgi:cytochrome o ubiquinol oxidase subunit IV
MNQTHHNAAGAGGISLKSYATGFILSIVLTLIPFIMVMNGGLSHSLVIFCIFTAAVLQIIVQLHYFLHLNTSSSMYWNMMSFLFTVFIIVLFVGGSIWIMHSLHYRM